MRMRRDHSLCFSPTTTFPALIHMKKTSHLTLLLAPRATPALFEFPTSPTAAGAVIVSLPVGSSWRAGPQTHAKHDETLEVLTGSIQVWLGTGKHREKMVLREGGTVCVERGVVVEWGRAEAAGQEVRVRVRWSPDE